MKVNFGGSYNTPQEAIQYTHKLRNPEIDINTGLPRITVVNKKYCAIEKISNFLDDLDLYVINHADTIVIYVRSSNKNYIDLFLKLKPIEGMKRTVQNEFQLSEIPLQVFDYDLIIETLWERLMETIYCTLGLYGFRRF